ncbi:CBS domain-containing protein [Balneolaceae bacterium YR4-1]|uniref:CBS domain-containing protein n=1 Tax=Halalkalibaculum roseum TaxID=2709311 RepID=A0A6M1T8F8_9BACT|nr:CBS domain-containing protein [Halalkalibaculum roseum]NGP76553.1 CBS domain-containing protein [Halalkalibaculum roseum]
MTEETRLKQQFTDHLLKDLDALEEMLDKDLFEKNVTRIGAEQEFCLIKYSLRPAMKAMDMLEHLNDDHFTTELARFNLELNLDPLEFQKDALSQLENNLVSKLTKANKTAHSLGAKIILTGILPTISKRDIELENISPKERYKRLNDAILAARASDFKFHISGIDELIDSHDNVLFESCNTSFQIHYQLVPEHAPMLYNWAHAVSAPVLAAATNSPLFMGKRLWKETRIALFQQSADTRKSLSPYREEQERVTFGKEWEKESALHIFQDIVSRHSVLLPIETTEDAPEVLKNGEIPALKALNTHNGTVYKWNRLCYGITDGVPHLRIENRYLPSGPTIVDEAANAAFWTGLMHGIPDRYRNIHQKMHFADVRNNFFSAAKLGLQSQFTWLDDHLVTAQDLILDEMIPIAENGLQKAEINEQDIEKYLGIIKDRVKKGKTGSHWMMDSYNQLIKNVSPEEASVTLTEGIYRRQKNGNPVHTWSELRREEGGGWRNRFRYVKQLMSKDLITLQEDDLVALAKNIMLWSDIHHIPVEDENGKLIGMLNADQILKIAGTKSNEEFKTLTAGEVMNTNIRHVSPDTRTREAFSIMDRNELGCLPVVTDSKLVGIITLNDYVKLMGYFFREISENHDSKQKTDS